MKETTQLIDINAERGTIGSMLINPDSVPQIRNIVDPADFHIESNRWIFQGMCSLDDKQQAPDYINLLAWLKKEGHLVEIGGSAYLTSLINATPNAFEGPSYARIVQRLGTLRRLVDAGSQIVKMAHTDNADVDALFEKARVLVDGAAPATSDGDVLLWLDSLKAFVTFQLERKAEEAAIEAGERKPRARYPWPDVDRITKTLRGGIVCWSGPTDLY